MIHDPVCMAEIDEGEAYNKGLVSETGNRKYYFCCDNCKRQFDRDPESYVHPNESPDTSESAYTDDYLG